MTQARSNTPKTTGSESLQRIDPLSNAAFVRIFGREESKPLTRSFINVILREIDIDEIGDIDEMRVEHADLGEIIGCKTSRFNVLIIADNADNLAERGARRQPGNIANRALFYGARAINTYVNGGTAHSDIPDVIVITLVDTQSEFDEDKIVLTATTHWHHGGEVIEASDKLRLVVVDLAKARSRHDRPESIDPDNEMTAWLFALTNGYRSNEELNRAVEAFPRLEEFVKQYDQTVLDSALIHTR